MTVCNFDFTRKLQEQIDNFPHIYYFQCTKFLDDQTILQWQHYSRKRPKLVENAVAGNTASVAGTPASNAPSHQSGNPQASSSAK